MENKKNILIISMTAGFGHVRAGEALLDYAKEYLSSVHAEHVDIITINPKLKKYAKIYDVIIKKLPFLWAAIYKYSAVSAIIKKGIFWENASDKTLKEYITKKNPDAIILTNVVALPMLASSSGKIFPDIKLAIVVTDYHAHPSYFLETIDQYFVPHIKVGGDLEKLGVSKEKITVTGIPINPRFYVKEQVGELKAKFGIKNNLPVVVFIASFKISKQDLAAIIKHLLEFDPPINLIFIANGNEEVHSFIQTKFAGHERLLMVNWTNVIEEYLKLSDVVISKAGGLTVSECIALQKPLIMVNPIPGQEEYNAEFVQKNNLGVKVNHISEIIEVLPNVLALSKNKSLPLFEEQNPCEKIFSTMLK